MFWRSESDSRESRENKRGREIYDDMASATGTNDQGRCTRFDSSTPEAPATTKKKLPKSLALAVITSHTKLLHDNLAK
eukprot:10593836-Ditylum_brightwellii.AAC.1